MKPVHDDVAELSLLGALLEASDDIRAEILDVARTHHFYIPAHQLIFDEMRALAVRKLPFNCIELTQHLSDNNLLDSVGGALEITRLATEFFMTASSWRGYFERLEGMRYRREAARVGAEIVALAQDKNLSVMDFKAKAEGAILALDIEQCEDSCTQSARDFVGRAMDSLEKRIACKGISGLSTGFSILDQAMDGCRPGEMIFIAGAPGSGKSALSMQMAETMAVDNKKRVLYFGAEMPTNNLAERQLCSRARFNLHRYKFRSGMTNADFNSITRAAQEIMESELLINDKPGMNIAYIQAVSRREHRRKPLDAIFVDYLQIIRGVSKRAIDSEFAEVNEVSAGLRDLAKSLNIPLIAAVQFNRESSKGKPTIRHLKSSGNLEQDAHVVILIHSDDSAENASEGEREIRIGKNRNGPVTVWHTVRFLKEFVRFEEIKDTGIDHG